MPKDHTTQWHHNRAFISAIDPDFPDWAVTATFYAAVHAVDALLEHDKISGVVSHEARNEALARISRYKKIWSVYHPLYGLARTVRYFADPLQWVPWGKIEAEIFPRYLYPLEQSVLKLMGRQNALPPVTLKPPHGRTNATTPNPQPFPT